MRPVARTIGFAGIGVALAVVAACTPTPNILPTNDLSRPTDIGFMCLGAFGQGPLGTDADGKPIDTSPFVVSGRPIGDCHPPLSSTDPKPTDLPGPSIHRRTFAFVTNSASGDLSVIDADTSKLVDLDKATGGYGRAPIGTQPEQLSTTTDGCRLVTANRGSCDLTLVNPATLLAPILANQYNSQTVSIALPPGNGIQRIKPIWPDGTALEAAPYEAVFLPQEAALLSLDPAKIAEGASCPADGAEPPTKWQALVTYPSCNLVALVNLPSGTIQDWAQGDATSLDFVHKAQPVCPSECVGGQPNMGPNADGGGTGGGAGGTGGASGAGGTGGGGTAGAGGGGGTAGAAGAGGGATLTLAHPTSIAIMPHGDRAYISFSDVPAVFSLTLTPTSLAPGGPGIQLHDGALGSNRIRLGVDPYAPGTPPGNFPGRFVGIESVPDPKDPDMKATNNFNLNFMYVIARDGSLRIVDVLLPGQEKECETNFDPLHPFDDPKKAAPTTSDGCIEYGSIHRRPSSADATSGLRFPSMPVDVAAAYIARDTNDEDTVNGGYAWVLTATGQIYLVNIDPRQRGIKAVVRQNQRVLFDPDPTSVAMYATSDNGYVYLAGGATTELAFEPPPFPNQPRDRNFASYTGALDPTLGLPRLDIPPIPIAGGPYIESFYTQGTEQDATALDPGIRPTAAFFPDRQGATQQSWDVTWQGTIVSPRYSGVLDVNALRDGGGQFCSFGVLAGDLVTLTGCTEDASCPLGMVCQRDPTLDQVPGGLTVTGLCLNKNMLGSLANSCARLTGSLRRYEIVQAQETQLILAPHYDEVVRSSLKPCRLSNGDTAGTGGTAGTSGAGGAGAAGGMTGMGGAAGMAGAGGAAGMGGASGAGGTGGTAGTAGGGGTSGSGGAGGAGGMGGSPEDDCFDPTDASTRQFRCVELSATNDGLPATGRRCLNLCTRDQDCRHGRLCLARRMCTPEHLASDNRTTIPADLSNCPGATSCGKDGTCFTDTTCDANSPCGTDSTCLVPDPAHPEIKQCAFISGVCADGPPLKDNACFPQLTSYQVNANASFWVTGSQSGSLGGGIQVSKTLADKTTTTFCAPDPNRDPRLVSRISLRDLPANPIPPGTPDPNPVPPAAPLLSAQCGPDPYSTTQTSNPDQPHYFFDHFDPNLKPAQLSPMNGGLLADPASEASQLVAWMNGWTKDITTPNACIYLGGPVLTESIANMNDSPLGRAARPQHVRARFRNTQVAFVLSNIDRAPPAPLSLHFDVHGGFHPETVVMLPTVEISAPARLVLSPIDSAPTSTQVSSKPAPFFYVVDQRRLGRGQGGGPTRGQIVRVNPFGFPTSIGYLPAYEDYQHSNGLFPIQ